MIRDGFPGSQPASENLRLRISRTHAFPDFNPFILRQADDVVTLLRTAAGMFLSAPGALDEEQMTIVVGAIGVGIAGCAALVAAGNYVVGNALAKSLVEHEVLTPEFGVEV